MFLHSFHSFVFCASFHIITSHRLQFSVGSVPVELLFSLPYCNGACFLALTLYFPYVFSGHCSATFTMFCTLLMPIFSLSYLVFSLCFQWVMFRKHYDVLYLIDAYFLTLPSMFLVFSVGSVAAASLCFVPYRCLSHSLTFYFPCVFSGQCSFHLCIVLSISNVFNEQYVFLKSFILFYFMHGFTS